MQKYLEKIKRCSVCGGLMLSKCMSLPKTFIEICPYDLCRTVSFLEGEGVGENLLEVTTPSLLRRN